MGWLRYSGEDVAAALTIAALIAGSALPWLVFAAPANADTTGTVKARTQRTSAPNLNSQTGWWEVGTPVDLQCSTHGQPVKGFFSFNIPGGWDNLWYRTPSGDYIADVDIETGTLNSVTPDCSALDNKQPPAPNPAVNLGPVDIQNHWCGPLIRGTAKATDPHNVYSWACFDNSGKRLSGVDMNATCINQYGQPAHAEFTDSSDAYSWYCQR